MIPVVFLNVLWIGDSIMQGMAGNLPAAYEAVVDPLPEAVHVSAESGWSTGRWIRDGDVRGLLVRYHPDLVVIALGTNDEGEEHAPERYARNIARLADLASADGATVIWIGAFTGTGIEPRFRVIQDVMGDYAIDGSSLMSGVSMHSEIHPDGPGYHTLARRVVQAVESRLASIQRPRQPRATSSGVVPVVAGAVLGVLALALLGR